MVRIDSGMGATFTDPYDNFRVSASPAEHAHRTPGVSGTSWTSMCRGASAARAADGADLMEHLVGHLRQGDDLVAAQRTEDQATHGVDVGRRGPAAMACRSASVTHDDGAAGVLGALLAFHEGSGAASA